MLCEPEKLEKTYNVFTIIFGLFLTGSTIVLEMSVSSVKVLSFLVISSVTPPPPPSTIIVQRCPYFPIHPSPDGFLLSLSLLLRCFKCPKLKLTPSRPKFKAVDNINKISKSLQTATVLCW